MKPYESSTGTQHIMIILKLLDENGKQMALIVFGYLSNMVSKVEKESNQHKDYQQNCYQALM